MIAKTDTAILIEALRILSHDIESGDGVANACISEGAERIEELRDENKEIRKIVGELGRISIDLHKRLDEIDELLGFADCFKHSDNCQTAIDTARAVAKGESK